jgi:hypothetical protein
MLGVLDPPRLTTNVSMDRRPASQIMEELATELAASSQSFCERVIEEFSGGIKTGTGTGNSPETRPISARADAVIAELRKFWGPTAEPSMADGVVPGRGEYPSPGPEEDCLFALFRRPGFWGYVRMRALADETPETAYLKLVLGVARVVE